MAIGQLDIEIFSPKREGRGLWILNQWCSLAHQEHWFDHHRDKYPRANAIPNGKQGHLNINEYFTKMPRYMQRAVVAHEINHLELGLNLSKEEIHEIFIRQSETLDVYIPLDQLVRLEVEIKADIYASTIVGPDHVYRAFKYTCDKQLSLINPGVTELSEAGHYAMEKRLENLKQLKAKTDVVSSGTYYGSFRR